MKQSQWLIPTLKETPSDAESASHQFLLRAGFIKQNAAGIYSYLPLGLKVLHNIETIIRNELDNAGLQELLMPAIQPAELWHETGRWDVYGPELMRLKDRHGRDFALGATHEELIVSLVRDELNSYKKLPMALYQIQTKYRDEKRPRFGLLRGREFIMKDAYSFHANEKSLDDWYDKMYEVYTNVFEQCGLDFRAVIADSGAMGGKDTHEFQALASIGEDTIAYSDTSDYAANMEMTDVIEVALDEKDIHDVDMHFLKTRDQFVVVYTMASDELNDVKVKNLLETDLIEELTIEERTAFTYHPLAANENVIVLADQALKGELTVQLKDIESGKFYDKVVPERDLSIKHFADLRFVKEGDISPDGQGKIKFARGIEIGQIFKLGTKYSEAMGATFLDENGRSQPIIMGCYGIGVSRTLSAVVEQYHDERGLMWPKSIAPFSVHLIAVNMKVEAQAELAKSLYDQLSLEYSVLFDDRTERAGVKFADSDLIGCPVRITVGKKASDGVVEIKKRHEEEKSEVPIQELLGYLNTFFSN